MKSNGVYVNYRKWPDTLHWHFTVYPLGNDLHGAWFVLPEGSVVQKGSSGLFDSPYGSTVPLPGFDVHPDGQRFIMVRPAASSEPPFTQMHIILNWTEELKRVAP